MSKASAFRLYARGTPIREIAHLFNVTTTTIRQWISSYRSQLAEIQATEIKAEILVETRERFDGLREEAFSNYRSAKSPKEKATFFSLLLETEQRYIKLMQETGILPSKDEKPTSTQFNQVNVQLNIKEVLAPDGSLDQSKLDVISAVLLQEQLEMHPSDILRFQQSSLPSAVLDDPLASPPLPSASSSLLPAPSPLEESSKKTLFESLRLSAKPNES